MKGEAGMSTVSVRYIVGDVDAAIAFYTELLGFRIEMHPAVLAGWLIRAPFTVHYAARW
jgi:catechol 2,3-dioxygenase-like lactoylglutathione lyase family enzyme